MKHFSDFVIHGARLARHLKGRQAPENEPAHAIPPLAVARTAATALDRLRQRMLLEGLGDKGGADQWKPDDDEGRRGLGLVDDDDDDDESRFAYNDYEHDWSHQYSDYDYNDYHTNDYYTKDGKVDWGGEDLAELIGEARSSPTSWKGEGGMKDFDEMVVKAIERCEIDVKTEWDMEMKFEAMTTKAVGFFTLYGSSFSHLDLKDPRAFPWAETIGPVLRAFKDHDEDYCSEEEAQKASRALEDYWTCADMEKLDFGDLVSDIQEGCQPLIDAAPKVINSAYINIGDIVDLVSTCLKNLLGDNAMGNFLRYEYNHFDKTLGCLGQFSEDLPHCVLRSPLDDGETLSLPLSLAKKPACLLGSTYEGLITYACIAMFVGLDECLPHVPAEDPGGYIRSPSFPCECENPFPFDFSIVTENLAGNKLPEFCAKVYEENGIFAERLQARLDYYDERGRTVDEPVPEMREEEFPFGYWSEYSGDEEEPAIWEGTWSDGDAISELAEAVFEAEATGGNSGFFGHGGIVILVGGVAVLVTVTSGLLIKYRGYGSSAPGRAAESNHSEHAVEVEQHEMI